MSIKDRRCHCCIKPDDNNVLNCETDENTITATQATATHFVPTKQEAQLFNLLCEKADDVYGGRLPVHVRCLVDEAANIGQIPNLEKLVATIRSILIINILRMLMIRTGLTPKNTQIGS